ncbi:MAG: mscM [Planctomycetota bacterium]|nr:mscM [Planctomycetota bacterium]
MRTLKSLFLQIAVSALWPSYIGLLAIAARIAPWPRGIARPAGFGLMVVAWALFAAALARFLCGPGGWAEEVLRAPSPAARQVRRGLWALILGLLVFLLPSWLLQRGLIASGDRPVTAPEICRAFLLAFEILALVVSLRWSRKYGPLAQWITRDGENGVWLARHYRPLAWTVSGFIAGIIVLDVQGFGFTARRFSAAGMELALLMAACWAAYWLIVQAIDHHSWHWVRWVGSDEAVGAGDGTADVAGKLRRLAAWGVPLVGVLAGASYWNIDLALFRSIGDQPIWPNAPGGVTVGDAFEALVISTLTLVAWRHLGAFFTVAVYPRMADDPGIRFAVLTLCRYVVLGVGMLAAMAALHLGPERIGYGLAALGVGLGFGLQEIVSNFVSGIILLLERPIRVGDVVTVAGMSGKVERINIRATTIINSDNQSLIVPNREFITANLVNWTHKDRILRVNIPLTVAYGADPDCVSDLLLAVARNDVDVLRNPVPSASMEGFGDCGMNFTLHVHVPDPSLAGRVKHRLCTEIQKKFKTAGFAIPMPIHEVVLRSAASEDSTTPVVWPRGMRVDSPSSMFPMPMGAARSTACSPEPAEPSHRGVDE